MMQESEIKFCLRNLRFKFYILYGLLRYCDQFVVQLFYSFDNKFYELFLREIT